MKLVEIVDISSDEQLDEINLKQTAAAGAIALSTLMSSSSTFQHHLPTHAPVTQPSKLETSVHQLVDTILSKYRVSPKLATKVATLAKKHEHAVFPKAEDILAIVGIESSFRPKSISNLKRDPAVGLMQVRPKVWGLDPQKLAADMELQVKAGADVLHKYYKLLGNKEDAVHAYNVGLGNFRRGNHNVNYVHKYENEVKMYDL